MAAKIFDHTNNVFTTQAFANPGAPTPITVTQDGLILSSSGDGLDLSGGGVFNLTINGQITTMATDNVTPTRGVSITGPSSAALSNVSVGGTGLVEGDWGIYSSLALKFTNAGLISGHNVGIEIGGPQTVLSTITNSGTISTDDTWAIFTGNSTGNFTINNTSTGILNGGIAGGAGIENLTNSFYIKGSVNLGFGNDIALNNATGIINQNVSMGDGNDRFTNYGTVGGTIDMGAGDDTFIGGAKNEAVYDNAGKDSYKLGDGIDVFYAVGVILGSDNGAIDTVDGGANTGINPKLGTYGDYYYASSATHDLNINLDTAIQKDILTNTNYAASTATGTDVGTDKIYNFEGAVGGSGNDVIFGNAAANNITGNAGNDTLYGLNGDDLINGGTGADNIFGGAGADKLSGSNSSDGSVDKFYFTKLTDSTVALAGRDTITYFEDTKDLIDLSKLALVNPTVLTGATDVFPGGGAGHAAVRVVSTHDGWTIQVDSNGDKKIDMAIDVHDTSHTISWGASDFVFV